VEKSKFRGKGQILQLGSKFRDPWKTVGPSHNTNEAKVHSVTQSWTQNSHKISSQQSYTVYHGLKHKTL